MSGTKIKTLSTAEHVFFAEETIVKITPSFEHPKMNFISGDFGPFSTFIETEVPLWLAISLKSVDKCKLHIPDWLSVEYLEDTLKKEKESDELQELPYYYKETSKLIIENFKDQFTEPDKIIGLLQDLENIRMDRLKLGIESVSKRAIESDVEFIESVQLKNVGSLEIHSIKRFILDSMLMFKNLIDKVKSDENNESSANIDENVGGTRRLRRFRT